MASAGTVTVNGSNVDATKEVDEPIHNQDFPADEGGKSVWWKWVAPASRNYIVSTAGSAFDTVLAIYTGSALNNLVLVGANDEDPATISTSRVSFNAVQGVTYYFAVDGFAFVDEAQSGAIKLSLSQGKADNDHFANRSLLSGAHLVATANSTTATEEPAEPDHSGNPGGKSLWWRWTAPATGSATFSTHGSDFDTVMGVYTGGALEALTEVASNDDEEPGAPQSTATADVVAGTEYQIAVDGFATSAADVAAGAIVLTIGMNDVPATLSTPTRSQPGKFGCTVVGGVGSSYGFELSTNLVNWERLQTVVSTNGSILFEDPSASGPRRFYRVVSP